MDNTIFYCNCSYTDPELDLTIKSCLETAKYPENYDLVFVFNVNYPRMNLWVCRSRNLSVQQQRVKRETRVDKIRSGGRNTVRMGRLKSTELSIRGRIKDNGDVALAPIPSDSQSPG